MFMRTLKVIKKQNKTQITSSNQFATATRKSLRKHTFSSIQNLSQIKQKSNTKFNRLDSPLTTQSPYKINKTRLFSFQNQYIRIHAKKQTILDQRKQCIKEKIKGKVKQQLADLIKRSQQTYSSLTDMKIKSQFIRDAALEVEIKGNSFKKSLRTSFTMRPEMMKLQKMRKSNNKRHSLKQSGFSEKSPTAFTVESSPRQKDKSRRSLSNIIRLHQITSQKGVRNSHSALDDKRTLSKKDSVEIEPWKYVEDF